MCLILEHIIPSTLFEYDYTSHIKSAKWFCSPYFGPTIHSRATLSDEHGLGHLFCSFYGTQMYYLWLVAAVHFVHL